MKHRATVIFIIVLAALVVAPRASQQLVALKDAAGSRIEATLWNAFLSLNGQNVEVAGAQPMTRVEQVSGVAAETVSAEKKPAEGVNRSRENSRADSRRESGRASEQQDWSEPLIAKFETPERLFSGPEDEGNLRFVVPKELPFDLDRLIRSAGRGAREGEIRARVRALEGVVPKLKIQRVQQDIAALSRSQAPPPRAPRARTAKGAARRFDVLTYDWVRPTAGFVFDSDEPEKITPRHARESHTEK
jgi:hypothetical protein